MAQGSVVIFEEHTLAVGTKLHNYDTDTHKISIHSALPATDTATPSYADFTGTEMANGNGYTTAGEAATCAYTEAGGTGTFALSSAVTWTQNASGFTTGKYAILYSVTAASSDAIGSIDLTADGGTTALSLVDGDITISAGTAFTLAKA